MSDEQGEARIPRADLLRMTADVVAAYLAKTAIATEQIPDVINTVFTALRELEAGPADAKAKPPKPAVAVRKSVMPDYLVCLEDGKKLKMLKRHLRAMYNMSPNDYRAKWGLPAGYPMVAPNYARQRSEFAKQIGLGRPGGKDGVPPEPTGHGAG